jgi:hypothetical protein
MKSFSFSPFFFNPHINDDFSKKKGIFFQQENREREREREKMNASEREKSKKRVQLVKQEIQSKFNSHT